MTRPFAAIERFFERLFERPTARLFHTSLQPVQIQRKLERAMDTGRVFSGDKAYVPTRYRVRLNPVDAQGFEGYRATLETELGDALHARARTRGYRLLARPTVALEASARIKVSDMDVVAEVVDRRSIEDGLERDASAAPQGPHGTGMFDPGGRRVAPATTPARAPQPQPQPQPMPTPLTAPVHAVPPPELHSPILASVPHAPMSAPPPRPLPSQPVSAVVEPTQTEPAPQPPPPAAGFARVEVRTRGAFMAACEFRGGTARIGRATDNEIVLVDDRVSRRHAQLTARQGNLVFTDLGSTNGSFVNGSRVREIVLGSGDVVRLGNSTLTIQPHA